MTTERALPWQPLQKVEFDFRNATLEALVGAALATLTVTRAGDTATRVNEQGLIEVVNANLPRFDYDPVTLECKGLLIEEARTNRFTRSGEIGIAPWNIRAGTTGTANQGTAPDGTNTATLISWTSGDGYIWQSHTASPNTSYSISVYVRRLSGSPTIAFNFWDGTAPSYQKSGVAIGDDWERHTYSITTDATSGAGDVGFRITGGSALIWGAQLEVGAFATSYIPTTSAAVTRNADVVLCSDISGFFNATEGTMVAEASSNAAAISGNQYVAEFQNGTTNERLLIYRQTAHPAIFCADGGATQVQTTLGAATVAGETFRVAYAYKANDFAGSLDGGAAVIDSAGTLPTVDRLRLGSNPSGGEYLNAHLRRLRYYPARVANDDVVQLAADFTLATQAIESDVVYPHLLYEGVFVDASGVDQTLRLWTGLGTLSWNSQSWIGEGNLLGVGALEESIETKAVGFSVTLAGQKSSNISLALNSTQRSQGRAGKVWLALFNAQAQLVDTPLLLKRGKLDIARIKDEGERCVIEVQYEDRLVDLQRPRERKYTDQDQRIDYPNDRGFEFVPALQDIQIPWGRAGVAFSLKK